MRAGLSPGMSEEMCLTITEEMCIDFLGDEGRVYSTPSMIWHIERLCWGMIERYLERGEGSVGTLVEIRHLAPAPLGARVWIRAELLWIEGRTYRFRVEVFDEVERICEGIHERVVIDVDRFIHRLRTRSQKRRGDREA